MKIINAGDPAELAGPAARKPAMTLVFKSERARDVFHLYLQQVQAGKVANVSVQMVLADLAEPIRLTDGTVPE